MNTPLTDAQIYETYCEGGYGGELAVDPEFARKLERDRARLIEFIQTYALGEASHSLLLSMEADK